MSHQLLVLAAVLVAHVTAVVVGSARDPVSAPRGVPSAATCQAGTPAAPPRAAPAAPRAVEPIRHSVSRLLYERVLADPMLLARAVRIVPAMRDGQPDGFKLYAIQPGSFLASFGFHNGDQVQTINDLELTSPDKALEAYAALRRARALDVRVLRHGQPVVIDIAFD